MQKSEPLRPRPLNRFGELLVIQRSAAVLPSRDPERAEEDQSARRGRRKRRGRGGGGRVHALPLGSERWNRQERARAESLHKIPDTIASLKGARVDPDLLEPTIKPAGCEGGASVPSDCLCRAEAACGNCHWVALR